MPQSRLSRQSARDPAAVVQTQRADAHADLEARAEETAGILALLSNSRRLLILCKLMQSGERPVGALAQDVGLSQSALSQHLALLRAEGIVGTRREAQTIYYRVTDPRVGRLLGALQSIFCEGIDGETPAAARRRSPIVR